MNERIQQLAKQAEDYAYLTGEGIIYQKTRDRYTEKFAELMVRECADVVSNQYSADWGKWSNTMILEHFGVEL